MTIQPCDHTSVGILVFRDRKLLLIDRKRPPLGLAAPAGHVDKHGDPVKSEELRFQKAAVGELQEETGLIAISLDLVAEGQKENPCRRPGGDWHYWRIYKAGVMGDLKPSTEETRGHLWCSADQMRNLIDGASIQMPSGPAGLELVWRNWFSELDILKMF